MSQLKVYVLFPLLLLGLLYAGIKLYIHQGVAGEVDNAIAMASPFAQIRYQGIGSSLGGSVSVEGVEIRVPQQPLPIRIQEIRLEGPGPGFLFDLAGGFDPRDMPEEMRLVVERIELPDVTETLLADLSLAGGTGDLPALNPPAECGLGWLTRRIGMFKSDAYPLLMDMSLGYRFDVHERSAQMDFQYQIPDRERIVMETRLTGLQQPGAVAQGSLPSLDRMTWVYSPGQAYVAGLVSGCAAKLGIEPDLYVQGLLAQPESVLGGELGIIPGAGLREAIRLFLLEPREIRVEIGPLNELFQLAAGPEPEPRQMIALLDPRVSVNGTPITDLSYREYSKTRTSGNGQMSSGDSGTAAKRRVARMLPATVDELPSFKGRDVEIYTPKHQTPLKGVLRSVANGEALVEQRVHGGTMAVHVPLAEITQANVYRYPRDGE